FVDLFFFQAEDGIRDGHVTGVQTCALPISSNYPSPSPLPNPLLCPHWRWRVRLSHGEREGRGDPRPPTDNCPSARFAPGFAGRMSFQLEGRAARHRDGKLVA